MHVPYMVSPCLIRSKLHLPQLMLPYLGLSYFCDQLIVPKFLSPCLSRQFSVTTFLSQSSCKFLSENFCHQFPVISCRFLSPVSCHPFPVISCHFLPCIQRSKPYKKWFWCFPGISCRPFSVISCHFLSPISCHFLSPNFLSFSVTHSL